MMDYDEWYHHLKVTGLRTFNILADRILSVLKSLSEDHKFRKTCVSIRKHLIVSGIIIGLIIYFIILVPVLQELTVSLLPVNRIIKSDELSEKEIQSRIRQLEMVSLKTENRLNRKIPYQSYMVVNSTGNKFYLYSRRKLIREGKCSTGSYIMLQAADERKWIFKTPRGVFRIQGKITSPVWKKPDWAFIEDGLPVPSPNSYLRYEFGVLGDYAMSLGQGYLIHGTLYQRFLGMPVTHGCIRLGDEDLKVVYQYLNIGSKVFIY